MSQPSTTVPPARHIPIEGTHNFRDAGGYITRHGRSLRWGTLFRSDSLHALTVAGRQAVCDLGIRTTVDLRADHEISRFPSVFADCQDLVYAHLPLSARGTDTQAPEARDLIELNRMFLDLGQASLLSILNALAAPGAFPAVVHCSVGKDRTGLLVALLQELAGATRQDVVADYVLTSLHAATLIEEITPIALAEGRDAVQFARLMECRAEVMDETLVYLDDHYGGAERYVRGIGVADAAVASLRQSLVEG